MDLVQIIVLALIQGLTEFLPISSSAHLILPSQVLGWPDQGLAFDVAVHVGTLAAVMIYFRQDVKALTVGWFGQFGRSGASEESRLAWFIIIATIPAGLAGIVFSDFIEHHLRSSEVIATTSILFGLLLWWSDAKGSQNKTLKDLTVLLVVLIGIAQAFALIPGTSRSGVTMTMALFLGLTRTDAARFSFLISIPIIILSGAYEGLGLIGASSVDWRSVILGAALSGISAFICIHFFLSFISKLSMLPLVIYRIALGILLFVLL